MSVHAINEAERTRLADTQRERPMSAAARRGELIVGVCFLVAALALPLIGGVRQHFSPGDRRALRGEHRGWRAHVRFDVGAGFTVPTQAVFVPMLFALPVALVPLLVALALALGMSPGDRAPGDARQPPADRAGQQLVRLGTGARAAARARLAARMAAGAILLLALAAQFACDFAANAVRERHARGHHAARARRGDGTDLPDRPGARPARARRRPCRRRLAHGRCC